MSTAVGSEYRSELLREVEARVEARGEGRAVLTVLDARGVQSEPAYAAWRNR
jgi:hypothetical protein